MLILDRTGGKHRVKAELRKRGEDVPGGTGDKNLPAESGGRGFTAQSGKMPHAMKQ